MTNHPEPPPRPTSQHRAALSLQQRWAFLSVDVEDDGTLVIESRNRRSGIPAQIIIEPSGETTLTERT